MEIKSNIHWKNVKGEKNNEKNKKDKNKTAVKNQNKNKKTLESASWMWTFYAARNLTELHC